MYFYPTWIHRYIRNELWVLTTYTRSKSSHSTHIQQTNRTLRFTYSCAAGGTWRSIDVHVYRDRSLLPTCPGLASYSPSPGSSVRTPSRGTAGLARVMIQQSIYTTDGQTDKCPTICVKLQGPGGRRICKSNQAAQCWLTSCCNVRVRANEQNTCDSSHTSAAAAAVVAVVPN